MFGLKIVALAVLFISVAGCGVNKPVSAKTFYVWNELTSRAEFPQSYGFPVFVVKDRMYAFHQEAVFQSADGAGWTKTNLPSLRQSANDTRYVQFNNAVYALGHNEGNYLDTKFGSTVRRTTDFVRWETLAEKSNLPNRIFYGAVAFGGKIWLMGGYDGKNYHNDIWNSADGVHWTQVAKRAAWTPRNVAVFEFKNRLWIFGGGVIDGHKEINSDSHKEVWSSTDGINWTKVTINSAPRPSGTPVVFDGKLWFMGGNRNDGNFDSAFFVSDDGINWTAHSAPWTPRGAVAAWVFRDKMLMTGGKYSYTEPNGAIKFVYSNDVWALSKNLE